MSLRVALPPCSNPRSISHDVPGALKRCLLAVLLYVMAGLAVITKA